MTRTIALLAMSAAATCAAQGPAAWSDPSTHQVRFVTVEDRVHLEVLDWGGTGRPLVLLAGSGNSAHVFDELAPKLTGAAHVYGITRRGYGASSQPASGYDDQRLADDVLKVLDALDIKAPVLAGHSMAGGELTTLGNQQSARLGGLVYVDALGDGTGDWPASDPAYMELLKRLPPPSPGPPCKQDTTSFGAYRAFMYCRMTFPFPEAELRNTFTTNPDGSVGRFKTPRSVHDAIGAGGKKRDYSKIRVPVLALYEFPRTRRDQIRPEDPQPRNEDEWTAVIALANATKAFMDRWVANLRRGVPDARIVDVPEGGHYLFITREEQVLAEIQAFLRRLPQTEP
jgi:pimeloyl-ACP methyl ester carboxylesterase